MRAIQHASRVWLTGLLLLAGHCIASPEVDYLLHCAGCHLENGSGMPPHIPDLRVDLSYFAARPEGRSYLIRVPGVSQAPISDADLAEVLSWVVATFAGEQLAAPFSAAEVSQHRLNVLADPIKLRSKLLDVRADAERKEEVRELGRALFFDASLSKHGDVSCATCHHPARAFSDSRDNGVAGAASRGQALGERNAPTLSYGGLVPARHHDRRGELVGGQFWDGRAADLEEQALRPLLNPVEMGLDNEAELADRIGRNPHYRNRFQALFGGTIFSDPQALAAGVGAALAAFQRSEEFAAFDSRYDRYLRGEYQPSLQESVGMALFFSEDFTNCSLCHQSAALPRSRGETFSNHRYENIGVPVNRGLRRINGMTADFVDRGLAQATGQTADEGRFRVPTLRNVAVTGPYMHNGVFKDLRTVLQFYNQYNRGRASRINPESGEPWREAEVPHTIALDRLQTRPALDEMQLDALLAFLHMLTDARFEQAAYKPPLAVTARAGLESDDVAPDSMFVGYREQSDLRRRKP
ncbi:cytochrome c peroxidase [Gilvimarinus sp. F26214L]|uniref:cytochrome c peroxidase n=1 Tax=Gilvimarinus sp. DZF01 TaxID=3461371 RepID=UPI004045B837